jgi:putative sigma-54 modulation protein
MGVAVRRSDICGPKGSLDQHCRVQLRLRGLPDIVVKDTEADLYVAEDRAGRTLGRKLQRARRIVFDNPSERSDDERIG